MLQSSITAWLKKPASVLKPKENVTPQSEPQTTPALAQPEAIQQDAQKRSDPIPAVQQDAPRSSIPSNPVAPETNNNVTTTSLEASSQPPNPTTAPTFNPPTLPPLPPNVELVPLTPDLLQPYKRLNTITFPISYPPAFYTETLNDPEIHDLTLIALWHSSPLNSLKTPEQDQQQPVLIGAIRCKILPSPDNNHNLYISTLSLLSPYRTYGIATHLLQRVTVKAVDKYGARSVMAHVWEMNAEGLEWYKKRGFEVVGKEEHYYRKLRPAGAMLVRKRILVGDLLGGVGGEGGFGSAVASTV